MTNAIIMASGLGTRLRPLTDNTPKPLIIIGDLPMIETVINALRYANVKNIYVVVGYLAEQFDYLCTKYPNVKLINNPDYESVNNISSVYYAREILTQDDCFICEADLFVSDLDIFNAKIENSCYFAKMVNGYSDDWVFDLDEKNYISRIGKVGDNQYNMVGLSYFTKVDARILSKVISESYGKDGYENLFWDDVVNSNLDKLKLTICPVSATQIVEIDTVDELYEIRRSINNRK